MDIIKNWLTCKLGLETPSLRKEDGSSDKADGFDEGLSNCVYFAEILRKYGILSDDEFVSLSHGRTMIDREKNMRHIQKWLTGSALKIQDVALQDVINEKPGAGISLLYRLYLLFEYSSRIPRIPGDKRRVYEACGDTVIDCDNVEGVLLTTISKVGASGDDEVKLKPEELPTAKVYTPYDRIDYPQKIKLEKPYLESSEASQAQQLYFARKAVELLQRRERNQLNVQQDAELRLEENLCNYRDSSKSWIPEGNYLDSASICQYHLQKQKQNRQIKLQNIWEDISRYDSNLVKLSNPLPDSELQVYEDGRGNPREYEIRVNLLKCRFQSEARDNERRALLRKSILKKFVLQAFDSKDHSVEVQALECLKCLPKSERALVDFLHRYTLREMQYFQSHTTYETRRVQVARNLDLEKKCRLEQQNQEFNDYAVGEVTNPFKSVGLVCQALDEPGVLDKLAKADGTIKDMIQRSLLLRSNSTPPPPPPCTPAATGRKRCRRYYDPRFGPVLVCEDEPGEDGVADMSICRLMEQAQGDSIMPEDGSTEEIESDTETEEAH